MTKIVKLSLVAVITIASTVYASAPDERNPSVRKAIQGVTKQEPKELDVVDGFKYMFEDGEVSGNTRSMHSAYNNDNDVNTYATALGGQLKYELAKYKGFNAAASFITTYSMGFASGNRDVGKRNNWLSSTKSSYTELSEAYINYEFQDLNFRVGRQLIDTPLADSDDIRMVPNTFDAYTISYEVNGFSFIAGHLKEWQGYDAELDESWIKTGDEGVNFFGITYSNDCVEANAWYYNISNASASDIANNSSANGNNAIYVEMIGGYVFNNNLDVHVGVQYLKESELDNSGIEANIYGAMVEIVFDSLGFNIAYNKSTKESGKQSFSGYGGGTLFTNMDNMILDNITQDRETEAMVAGFVYGINDFYLLYAYGDFKGNADSVGIKANIVEQNIGVEYSPNDNFTVGAIYVVDDNKDDGTSANFLNDYNGKNFRVLVSYNF